MLVQACNALTKHQLFKNALTLIVNFIYKTNLKYVSEQDHINEEEIELFSMNFN